MGEISREMRVIIIGECAERGWFGTPKANTILIGFVDHFGIHLIVSEARD